MPSGTSLAVLEDVDSEPRVSIVTPAYNAESCLGEAIRSVLEQTVSDFELLIVDDGSIDDSFAVAKAHAAQDSRVRIFRQPHGGSSAARNTGLRHASGDLVALLDSDDVWMPDYLERQLELLERFPSTAVVTANAINRGGRWDGRPLWPASSDVRPIGFLDMIQKPDSVCGMSVFRRPVVNRIGGFDEALPSHADYQLWLRAAHAGFRFVANFRPCAWYRRRPDDGSGHECRTLAGLLAVLRHVRVACRPSVHERDLIDRQIDRFERDLLAAQAKASLYAGDLQTAADRIRALYERQPQWTVALAAAISRHWIAPLAWGYRWHCSVRDSFWRLARAVGMRVRSGRDAIGAPS